jgi:membrane protein implicated in regulation of membrane protease activity
MRGLGVQVPWSAPTFETLAYTEDMHLWIWLAISGSLMLVELITANLLFASLAVSALAAAGAAALGADVALQGITFGVAAVLSLILLRPIALKHLKVRGTPAATNVDALIGAEAITLTAVNDRSGQVKLTGETWSARTQSGVIAADQKVQVVAIRGATAIIKGA